MTRRTAYLRLLSFRRAIRKGGRPRVTESSKEAWLRFRLLRSMAFDRVMESSPSA